MALLVCLLLLWRSVLLKNPVEAADFSHRHLYAERILEEISSQGHGFFEEDEVYSKALFRRYAQFLWMDMRSLIRSASGPRRARSLFFCIWYAILRTDIGFNFFGRRHSEGLNILLASMIPVVRVARSDLERA